MTTPGGADTPDGTPLDDAGDFYTPNEARFYILAYLLGRSGEESLLAELAALGEKLEEDEEAHEPALVGLEDRAVETVRRRFPGPDFFQDRGANEEAAALLRRFEILHLIELVDEHEEPWALDRAREFLASTPADFEKAFESAEDALIEIEESLLSELENLNEGDHDHPHDPH